VHQLKLSKKLFELRRQRSNQKKKQEESELVKKAKAFIPFIFEGHIL
jgi:hypothetical protein